MATAAWPSALLVKPMATQANPGQRMLAPAPKPTVPLTLTLEPKTTPSTLLTVVWPRKAKLPSEVSVVALPPAHEKKPLFASSHSLPVTPPARNEALNGYHI